MVTSEFKRGVLESRGDNQFTHVVSTDHDTRSLSAA
jgi:hypothetical protein